VVQAHQIGPSGIDGNGPEALDREALILLNKHIANFTASLSKSYEKYTHEITPSERIAVPGKYSCSAHFLS
jgi:hypothetical protein